MKKLSKNARVLRDICQKNYQNARIFMIFAPPPQKKSSRILHGDCPKNIFPEV